ncbi:hypothetical protein GCM10010384_54790 [Streptomyces djakartensis]|uniref:Uncharacterized protein n=2 Tax=Streptomyces djakartensis TaxID=68193 RepID=A0ABQ3A9M2_9ACTN|nr:hypothetical protein GCM10010384_54790 [Streptomyces djakartensis]
MAAVNADPEVMRWIGDGGVRDEQQTRRGIEAMEREWDTRGFSLFAVEIRSTRPPSNVIEKFQDRRGYIDSPVADLRLACATQRCASWSPG